jgi:hypothetical protein
MNSRDSAVVCASNPIPFTVVEAIGDAVIWYRVTNTARLCRFGASAAKKLRVAWSADAFVFWERSPASASHPNALPGIIAATKLDPTGATEAAKFPWLSGVLTWPL